MRVPVLDLMTGFEGLMGFVLKEVPVWEIEGDIV